MDGRPTMDERPTMNGQAAMEPGAGTPTIDSEAPVVVRTQIFIPAEPQLVWDTLTDFAGWPTWKSGVTSMKLEGPIAAGATFVWKAGPGTIRSRFAAVAAPRLIAWTGTTFGIRAIDVFRLEPTSDGTLVVEEESWTGLLPRLFPKRMRRSLQTGLERGLAELKAEVTRSGRET